MIFRLIDGIGTFTISHALSYQKLARLDSHYITRRESGVLCGSIKMILQTITTLVLFISN